MENSKQTKVSVKNLKKNFGKLEVLKDIDLEIQEGEVVVLLGPSGSGKSTFLRCLNRLEEITAGEVTVDGISVSDKKTDINKLRENIGMVFQHFNLFPHMTVLENIMLAPVELKKMTWFSLITLFKISRRSSFPLFNAIADSFLVPKFASENCKLSSDKIYCSPTILSTATPAALPFFNSRIQSGTFSKDIKGQSGSIS